MGLLPASNRHFTVSPQWHTRCLHDSGLQLAAILQCSCLPTEEKWSLLGSGPLFLASFGKLRLSDQVQFIAWHGIQLYGFSAVKVKLVDSLI